MNILSARDAAEELGMSSKFFIKAIIPLMVERGVAAKIGNQWIVDGDDWQHWRVYANERASLIERGVWNPQRPWSLEDFENIVYDLVDYDD